MASSVLILSLRVKHMDGVRRSLFGRCIRPKLFALSLMSGRRDVLGQNEEEDVMS